MLNGEYYNRTRKSLNENIVNNVKAFDRVIFVTTTGGLALSITVFGVMKITEHIPLWFFFGAMVLFLVALLLHSFAYWHSIYVDNKKIDELERWGSTGYKSRLNLQRLDAKTWFGRSYFDVAALVTLVFGIIMMLLFVGLGLFMTKESNMDVDEKAIIRREDVAPVNDDNSLDGEEINDVVVDNEDENLDLEKKE